MTECGTKEEGSGARASVVRPGVWEHDEKQERFYAGFLPKIQIILQSLGIERSFFFVFPPFNENSGTKDWGIMRRDFTVKSGYAAFSTLTFCLGNAVFRGRYGKTAGVESYLYELPDGTQTIAFWRTSKRDNSRTVFFPAPSGTKGRLTNCVGSECIVTAGSGGIEVSVRDEPQYLSGLRGLTAESTLMPRVIRKDVRDNVEKRIVLQLKTGDSLKLSPFTRDYVEADNEQKTADVVLTVWNFSDQEMAGRIWVKGGTVVGVPESCIIPAGKSVSYPLTLQLVNEPLQKLVFSGIFGQGSISPLSLAVRKSGGRTEMIPVPLNRAVDPVCWKANSSGRMTVDFDRKQQAVRFDVEFPQKVDRWCYPEFRLQLPQESLQGAYCIEFEVKAATSSPLPYALFWVRLDGKLLRLPFEPPTEKWEKRSILLDALDGGKITALQLGTNPRGNISLWVRNFKVLYRK